MCLTLDVQRVFLTLSLHLVVTEHQRAILRQICTSSSVEREKEKAPTCLGIPSFVGGGGGYEARAEGHGGCVMRQKVDAASCAPSDTTEMPPASSCTVREAEGLSALLCFHLLQGELCNHIAYLLLLQKMMFFSPRCFPLIIPFAQLYTKRPAKCSRTPREGAEER